jgi:hypothetical protein
MDFLLDVNASGAVARWLLERGHNVAEVSQTDPRMNDDKILSWAVREMIFFRSHSSSIPACRPAGRQHPVSSTVLFTPLDNCRHIK